MADPIVIALSAGQCAVFASLSQQEAEAQKTLDRVPAARSAAAMVVALESHTIDQVQGVHLQIDTQASTLTFVPNEPQGPKAVD